MAVNLRAHDDGDDNAKSGPGRGLWHEVVPVAIPGGTGGKAVGGITHNAPDNPGGGAGCGRRG